MTIGAAWAAGAVRARSLGRHRLGPDAGRRLASATSLEEALRDLADGPYGRDVRPDLELARAQRMVWAVPLWQLRVLAGWLPAEGAELVRALVAWWEVLNVEDLVAGLEGARAFEPYDLGRLETGWHRLREAESLDDLRRRLAASPWRDPGSDDPVMIVSWLRLAWAQRVADEVEPAYRLAAGWAALTAGRTLAPGAAPDLAADIPRIPLLGDRWREAGDLAEMSRRLPRDAAWVLGEHSEPEDLWRAEVGWWRALDSESLERLVRMRSGAEVVTGAFGVLLADAQRVQGALELAARGGTDRDLADEAL